MSSRYCFALCRVLACSQYIQLLLRILSPTNAQSPFLFISCSTYYSRDEIGWVFFNSFFSFSVPMTIMALHMNTLFYFDCFCHQEFQNIVHDGSLHHSHYSHCLHWFHCFYCLQLHYVWTHYSIMLLGSLGVVVHDGRSFFIEFVSWMGWDHIPLRLLWLLEQLGC